MTVVAPGKPPRAQRRGNCWSRSTLTTPMGWWDVLRRASSRKPDSMPRRGALPRWRPVSGVFLCWSSAPTMVTALTVTRCETRSRVTVCSYPRAFTCPPTMHNSDHRIALQRAVVDWLQKVDW